MQSPSQPVSRRALGYGAVFIFLAVITAVELALSRLNLPDSVVDPVFLVLSLGKASLVAAFYMHLRQDNRFYTVIFVLPVLLLVVFALLTIVI
jgi:cytochrome c oxidase subunit 4